ncbi:AI-2E family transporter [Actinomycetospora cinnamomea]|uniref:Putative PurR-regulated permease PerM n=1 Tax=Actinomycetospora cinnamomea TaxID=663609 RepID=A0A2U1F2K1_9PSEU|nr:AI-2E family transporter [Actinomycetospora cinnamomea]PVZ06414.1 putative PurR-regulated permease PerM [Actinomycetospora cinnamomea]
MDRTEPADDPSPAAVPPTAPAAAQRTSEAGPGIPRGLVLLLGAAAVVIAAAGLYWVSWLVGPLLLAMIIVIAIYPIKTWLERRGWPTWAAVVSLLVVIFGAILLLSAFLAASVSQLAALLGQNSGRSQQLIASLSQQLTRLGIDPTQSGGLANQVNPDKLVSQIGAVLSGLGSVAGTLIFILALLLFLTAESGSVSRRMQVIHQQRPHMTEALSGFTRGTRSYLVVTTVFGAIVAVLDTVALVVMGIPLALLWGVLAFITNYIPNIGFIIGLVPPALLALLTGGWQLALAVVIVYCILNAVIQSLIQPRFVGDSVGLSATVTFVALLFWAWILGPLGALLAVPMTLLVKAVLVDADPRAQWVEALLGADPPSPKSVAKTGRKAARRAGKKAARWRGNGDGRQPRGAHAATPTA